MNRHLARWILMALMVTAGLSPRLPQSLAPAAPNETKTRDTKESEETTRLAKAELPNWKLWKGADRKAELKLDSKSVLRWTNPEIGRVYGNVYLWTADGRPEVVMSLLKSWAPADDLHAEMHSLSLEVLEANRDGKRVWQPKNPGVELRDVPGAPRPVDTPVRRLSQMRALAREFTAELTDFRRDKSGVRQPLRLLPQPMYRYESTAEELIDGAVFAFVLGTDPEVFLLLEARRFKEAPRWQFGLARMNPDPLAVMHHEKEVWNLDRADLKDQLRDPYVLIRVREAPR